MHYKKIPLIKYYFMMNKAQGVVCSSVSDRHKTVFDDFADEVLISPEGAKLHTVGRLDQDAVGLLILTNDGKFSNYLTRPENKIAKTYLVKLKNPVTVAQQKTYKLQALQGLTLPPEKKYGEQKTSGAKIQFTDEKNDCAECKIILTQGKFHEVKRIFRALKNEVIFLKRISIATLKLDENLKPGEYRPLASKELEQLYPKDYGTANTSDRK